MPARSDPPASRLPQLPRELGDGLLLRQATALDVEAAAGFVRRIHGSQGLAVSVRDLMGGDHPTTGAGDFLLVVDTCAGQRIVAMAGLLSQTWAYDGIAFGVGNPEFVTTDPTYRRRGLMRAVMDALHTVSAARGHWVQAIQGLRWFYRQFEYEYALNPGPSGRLQLSDVPPLPDGEAEPFRIRPIAASDIPAIVALYRRQCTGNLVTNVVDETMRRYDLSGHAPGSDLGDWGFAVVDPGDRFVGYFSTWGDPWGAFTIKELATTEEEALRCVLPSLLRFIRSQRITYAAELDGEGPAAITFDLGANHPAYTLLAAKLGPLQSRPDWYVRVRCLPGFVRHIAPVLERRLADSAMCGFTGELKLSFFHGGLRLRFDRGLLSEVSDWDATEEYEPFAVAGLPPLVFLKLLFGYRSFAELCYAYPDCWAGEQDRLLLNALFPKQPSWLRML